MGEMKDWQSQMFQKKFLCESKSVSYTGFPSLTLPALHPSVHDPEEKGTSVEWRKDRAYLGKWPVKWSVAGNGQWITGEIGI